MMKNKKIGGKIVKKSKILITTLLIFLFAMCISPITTFAEGLDLSEAKIDIEGVKFNYIPGDKPQATAYKCDPWDELYDIEYEYWEEMEMDETGELIPIKFWYSDNNKNNALSEDKKIDVFEEGKTYMYSISLKAKDGNKFGNNSLVSVNNKEVNSKNVTNYYGTTLFATSVETIKPTKPIQLKQIDVIELNNATISFNVNDKPIFTGKTPDKSPYIYQFECWEDNDGTGITSAEFFNKGYKKHITAFENGKEYQYILYFKSEEGYTFTRQTKLKINGKYYNYRVSDWEKELNVDEFSTTWRMYVDLKMLPTSLEHNQDNVRVIENNGEVTGSITFEKEISKNYTLDIKKVEVKKELAFKNIKYIVDINVLKNGEVVKINDTKMQIKIALPEELKGYKKYEVVYISNDEIKETIPATVKDGYIVFETSHLSEYGIIVEDKNINNPNTIDNIVFYMIMFVSVLFVGCGLYSYSKKEKN